MRCTFFTIKIMHTSDYRKTYRVIVILLLAFFVTFSDCCSGENVTDAPLSIDSASSPGNLRTDTTYSRSTSRSSITFKEWPARLRGLNTKLMFPLHKNNINPGGFIPEEIFKKLARWHINVIRVPINADSNIFHDNYRDNNKDIIQTYYKHIQGLKHTLELAQKYNIYVIVSAGRVIDRKKLPLCRASDRKGYWKQVVKLWKYVASVFGSYDKLLGYDLLNEPDGSNDIWQGIVMPEIIKTIREVDRDTYLVIEPAPGGSYRSFKDFVPIKDAKVVYSFHFYAPHNYTHQGIGRRKVFFTYPGYIKHFNHSPKIYWDREQLENQMIYVENFQKKYHKRIFVGEFGVVRWAPGGARWLEDVISTLEEHRWDWCFFSLGGWNGWNPTFGSNDPICNEIYGHKITDRLKVLIKYWNKNIGISEQNL